MTTPVGRLRLLGALPLAILLLVPAFGNNYVNHVLIEMFLLAYLGQAWNIMCGYTGQMSFGHAAFFGVGAYTSSLLYLRLGLTPWLGMLAGGLLALVIGIAIGSVSLRYGLRGVYFAFLTLTAAEVLRLLTQFWESLTKGAEGILLPWKGHNPAMFAFEVHKKYLYYYTILAMLVACTVLAQAIKRSRLGYYLAAIRGNVDAAEILGINTARYQIVAIAISAFLTALGGTFTAQYYQHFEPEVVFGPMRSFDIIFPVILGGGGHVLGPPIGAFLLQFFEEVTRAVMPATMQGLDRMIYAVLIVVMMMYLPGGVVSLLQRLSARVAR